MSIPSNKYDIEIECGADFALSFVIRDDGGSLVNLADAVITAQLREYAEAQDYIDFTAVHNSAGGKITLTMAHEDTANISYTQGVYDVFVTLDGTTEKVVYGDVTVYPNVTKPVEGEVMYLLSFNTEEDLPAVGMMRRVYFCHASSFMYRWNGTAYVGMNMNTYWDDIPDKPETFPPSEHTHDDRYYTETETDTLLSGKSDTGHTHDDRYYTETETDTLLLGKSDTSHTHDDRYYTESEMDTALAGKSDTSHTHDDRYYTESEVDTFLSTKADSADLGDLAEKDTVDWDSDITNIPEDFPPSSHDHDDRYYTEDEMDTLLSAKADSADLGDLAAKDKVDWDTDIDDIPSTFPPESHTHDDRYYTESEIDTALSGKSDTSHTHDDRYYTETESDSLLAQKADIIHTSASGALVHITDAGAYPVDSLTVGIEPVQDLHGYDAPWPAGGGKNVLKPPSEGATIEGVTFTVDKDADGNVISITANGTCGQVENANFYMVGENGVYADAGIPSGTYICSGNSLSYDTGVFYIVRSDGNIIAAVGLDSRETVTIDSSETYRIFVRIQKGKTVTNVKFYPMIRPSSVSDATFAPYSNICPISGWSTAVVTRTGINIWDEEMELGGIQDTTGQEFASNNLLRSVNYIPCLPETNYYFCCSGWGNQNNVRTRFYDLNKNYLGAKQKNGTQVNKNSAFTTPDNCYFMRFVAPEDYGTTYNNDISINYPATDTQYHAYNGASLTVDLNGTRYGGTLNVLTGELTVDREFETFTSITNGSAEIDHDATLKNGLRPNPVNSVSDDILISSYLPTVSANAAYGTNGNGITVNNAGILRIRIKDFTTKSEYNTYLTANPLQVVYPLATPFTVQLSPATMSLLKGENNLWADTNGDVTVGYRSDTKLYIDSKLASAVAELQALILENS